MEQKGDEQNFCTVGLDFLLTFLQHCCTNNVSHSPKILLHPSLQLFGDLLLLPLFDFCDKHSGVKGAVVGVDGQVFHFLLSVVQEAHVGGLRNKLRKQQTLAININSIICLTLYNPENIILDSLYKCVFT